MQFTSVGISRPQDIFIWYKVRGLFGLALAKKVDKTLLNNEVLTFLFSFQLDSLFIQDLDLLWQGFGMFLQEYDLSL